MSKMTRRFSPIMLLTLAFIGFIVIAFVFRAGLWWYQNKLIESGLLTSKGQSAASFLLSDALCWLPALVLAPAVFWLLNVFPVTGAKKTRSIVVHIVASIVFALAMSLLYFLFLALLGFIPYQKINTYGILSSAVGYRVLTYWLIFAFALSYDYYRRLQDRELKAAQLETQLAQAKLQVLKMQLHPHFLFNTLNAISALVHRNPAVADKMISRLSDMLRQTLETADIMEIPLKEELDALEPYLDIEKMRLGDRLTVSFDIASETEYALVPNFLLQPLLENSIRHGIAHRIEGGRVTLDVSRNNAKLEIKLTDDGVGFDDDLSKILTRGLGLSMAVKRLEKLYGNDSKIDIRSKSNLGTQILIEIPFKTLTGEDVHEH